MDEAEEDQQTPRPGAQDAGSPKRDEADDDQGQGGLDEQADYTGLPRSVFGRAMLALLAVFWIVAVIMLFTQGGK
jgi:hypothetical protein